MSKKSKIKCILVLVVPLVIISIVFGPYLLTSADPNRIIYHHIDMYAGDFDYAENNTIYFKGESGFSEVHFPSGTVWSTMGNENQWTPYFKIDGYNFSALNNSNAKCVNVFVDSYRNVTEWHSELNRVVLTFYDKAPETFYADDLKENNPKVKS